MGEVRLKRAEPPRCFLYTTDYPGPHPEGIARAVDWSNPARPKLEGEFVKPNKALVWMAYSLERKRPELLIREQVDCLKASPRHYKTVTAASKMTQ